MSDLKWRAAILALAVPALAGCGGASPRNAAPPKSAVNAAFQGSPAALASLHGQANQLLSGGIKAFSARLRALRGHPVVVNKWASWCVPCQSEFPSFQKAAVKYGREVAFIGLDANDHDAAATAFLRQFPVTYPSYTDPRSVAAGTIGASTYFPMTIYFTAGGKRVFDHAGPYLSAAALERDIREYALQ